jgi:hypothetical protein
MFILFTLASSVQINRQRDAQTQISPYQEDTMTTQIIDKNETKTDVAHETSKFTIGAVMTLAGMIGIWAMACLIGGLASGGIGGLIKGFISAILGN